MTKPSPGDSWISHNHGRLGGTSPGHPSNALTRFYSPTEPSKSMSSSQGLVVQALRVVSDPAATHSSLDHQEATFSKISKRRKKANGQVDVEHTKSSNQFLRKLQETLIHGESSDEERPEGDEFSSSDRESDGEPHPPIVGSSLLRKEMQYTIKSKCDTSLESTAKGEESTEQDLDDAQPKYQSLLRNSVQYSRSSKHTSNHPHGDEASETTRTTPSPLNSCLSSRGCTHVSASTKTSHESITETDLGYDDPDAVMRDRASQRIPGGARRRNSVTEHTLGAELEGSEFSQINLSDTPRGTDSDHAAAAQRLQNIQGFARKARESWVEKKTASDRTLNQRWTAPDRRKASMDMDSGDAGASSDPFGYEDMGMDNGTTSQANAYGYENPDAAISQHAALGYEDPDASNNGSNPYGYGDEEPQREPQARQRPRAQRRGSVTKFSLEAASHVEAVLKSLHDDDVPSRGIQPDHALSPRPDVHAPSQPTRRVSPWYAKNANFAVQSAALGTHVQSLGPPTVHTPPRRAPIPAASFRSESSYRSSRSGDILYDSSDDEQDMSLPSSDESSLGEGSVTSITVPLKDCQPSLNRRDGPMRPPDRHDSMRSFASRGSARSARTMDSDDGDSLAPDMKSLCSISKNERTVDRVASGSLPMFLPHTPTADSQMKKFMSPRMQARRTTSGDMVPAFPVETYIDTSPLPSPRAKGLRPRTKDLSINGNITDPSLDTEMGEKPKSNT